jgi:hypothetical protein
LGKDMDLSNSAIKPRVSKQLMRWMENIYVEDQ